MIIIILKMKIRVIMILIIHFYFHQIMVNQRLLFGICKHQMMIRSLKMALLQIIYQKIHQNMIT
eukprot:jgi/Orpsp1_1/1178113/evm.model.c7180000064091.1